RGDLVTGVQTCALPILSAGGGHRGQGYDGPVAPQLFLIDGNSLVYRAFFALPDSIATSKGEPTNAIFGFASMLVKLLTEYGSVQIGRASCRERVVTAVV